MFFNFEFWCLITVERIIAPDNPPPIGKVKKEVVPPWHQEVTYEVKYDEVKYEDVEDEKYVDSWEPPPSPPAPAPPPPRPGRQPYAMMSIL